jgi:hypothetical protein
MNAAALCFSMGRQLIFSTESPEPFIWIFVQILFSKPTPKEPSQNSVFQVIQKDRRMEGHDARFFINDCVRFFLASTATSVSLNYLGALSASSPMFSRPGNSTGYHYYQAIRVTVSTAGTYIFISNSSMDAYGCFYYDPVDPSYPSQNLITSNDDGNGDRQFRINVTLQYGRTYVLVVTTFSETTTGSFSIRVFGPASVGLILITPSTSRPIRTTSE